MSMTIKELSKLAGVSTATVSLVLSDKAEGRVSAARQEAILKLARKHGYRSNLAARGLAEGRTYRIAVCIEGELAQHAIIGNFSLYERLGALAHGIKAAGYSLTLVQTDASLPADEITRQLQKEMVDSYVLLFWPPDISAKTLFSLKEKHIPAVAIDCGVQDDGFTWVQLDRQAGFVAATRRLVREGRSGIALLDTDIGAYADVKLKAFLDTLREDTGQDGSDRVFRAGSGTLEHAIEATEEAIERVEVLDGLLLMDNFCGEAVLHVLANHGIQAGRDCRVIGFGETDLAERCSPKLSHYSLRIADQVSFCLDALFEQIRDPSNYVPRHADLVPRYEERET